MECNSESKLENSNGVLQNGSINNGQGYIVKEIIKYMLTEALVT